MLELKEYKGYKIPTGKKYCRDREGNCQGVGCSNCIFGSKTRKQSLAGAEYILTHLNNLEYNIVPFGLLSEEKQREFRKAWNGKYGYGSNVTVLDLAGGIFREKVEAAFHRGMVYRLKKQDHSERIAELVAELEKLGKIKDGKVIV